MNIEPFIANDYMSEVGKTAAAHFAMYSAAAFAMFNYMVLSAIRSSDFTQKFIRRNLLVCVLIASGFGLL